MMPDKELTDNVLDSIIAESKTSMEQYLALQLKAERSASQPYTVPDEIPIEITEGVRHGVVDGKPINPHRADGWNACRAAMLQSGNSPVWIGIDWAKGCGPVAHVDERAKGHGSICWTKTGRELNLKHGTPLFVANSPVIPDGWQLAPKKPTREMIGAAAGKSMTPIECWEVMIAAAPQHKGE